MWKNFADVLEIIMLICFGLSWPLNVIKSYKARTTKGKSLPFICLIILGYIAGIGAKFVKEFVCHEDVKWYMFFVYFLNLFMVSLDLVMYFRNYKLDKQREANEINK